MIMTRSTCRAFLAVLTTKTAGSSSVLRGLEELAHLNPRQALMVECRFFGGLDIAQTAELLQVSEATLSRDWRVSKAWLATKLRGFG